MENQGNLSPRVMVRCEGVKKTFGEFETTHEVIERFDYTVYENEFVVILGPGQCGKSTLLNLIAGLEPVSGGSIEVNGKPVKGPDPERGMVYQTTNLFPWLTVMGNVEFGPKMRGVPKKERRKKAQSYIELVGLKGFEDSFPSKLSGGMCQRVGIARAYCNDPAVILMDEPFGHLDAQTRYLMEEEIERICASERRTVLFVTNNVEEAIYLADRIILLTNCPATVKREYLVDLPRPRSYVSDAFLALREQITADMDMTN